MKKPTIGNEILIHIASSTKSLKWRTEAWFVNNSPVSIFQHPKEVQPPAKPAFLKHAAPNSSKLRAKYLKKISETNFYNFCLSV